MQQFFIQTTSAQFLTERFQFLEAKEEGIAIPKLRLSQGVPEA
jgi:hypothetical protein